MNAAMSRTIAVKSRQQIEVRKLSSVLDQVAVNAKRILLKSDTQGYDLEVFCGAAGVLDRLQVLWVEISFRPIYKGAPDYREALAEFEKAGFAVSAMFPVVIDKALRGVEFDCALVRL